MGGGGYGVGRVWGYPRGIGGGWRGCPPPHRGIQAVHRGRVERVWMGEMNQEKLNLPSVAGDPMVNKSF